MYPNPHWVPQRHATDCGVAAVAMIVGVTYEEAFEAVFPNASKNKRIFTTTSKQLTKALERLGMHVQYERPSRTFHSGTGILNVERRRIVGTKRGYMAHWIVQMGDGGLLDPDRERPLTLNEYKPRGMIKVEPF